MFCPKCGKADQNINSYCRQCGVFLPDFSKAKSSVTSPEEHLKANTILNFMTAIASLTLATLLYSFLYAKKDTSILIYITAAFLTAIFAWQVQIIIRTYQIKKHLKKRSNPAVGDSEAEVAFEAAKTRNLLDEADFTNSIPVGVTEKTTRNLTKDPR